MQETRKKLAIQTIFAALMLFLAGFIYRIYFIYPKVNLEKSKLGLKVDPYSFIVDDVYSKGVGYQAGIRKGDVIFKANERQVKDIKILEDTINANIGKRIGICVLRGRQTEYFWVKIMK